MEIRLQNTINEKINNSKLFIMKKTHGGANRGQGRKSPFTEPTKIVSVRSPLSKIPELKAIINEYLNQFKTK